MLNSPEANNVLAVWQIHWQIFSRFFKMGLCDMVLESGGFLFSESLFGYSAYSDILFASSPAPMTLTWATQHVSSVSSGSMPSEGALIRSRIWISIFLQPSIVPVPF